MPAATPSLPIPRWHGRPARASLASPSASPHSVLCGALTLALCLAPAAQAQDAAGLNEDAQPPDRPAQDIQQTLDAADNDDGFRLRTVRLFGNVSHAFDANIDDAQGEVSITRYSSGVGLDFAAGRALALALDIEHEASDYDFSGLDGTLPTLDSAEGEPFDTLHDTDISLTTLYFIDQQWSVLLGGSVGFGYENDADLGDALTYRGFGAVGYAFSDDFSLSLGAAGFSRIEEDPLIVPFVGFDWQINEVARLTTRGLGAELSVDLDDTSSIALWTRYQSRNYRLADDNDVAPDGVLEDDRLLVGLALRTEPLDNLELSIRGGAVVWQEYEIRDEDGDELNDFHTDPAGFIGIRLSYSF